MRRYLVPKQPMIAKFVSNLVFLFVRFGDQVRYLVPRPIAAKLVSSSILLLVRIRDHALYCTLSTLSMPNIQ